MATTGTTGKRRIGPRIATALVLAIACVALFDIPGAYIHARGWPMWLAFAVGLATFPIVPLAWHAYGERKRKRAHAAAKTPPRSSTTGWERLGWRGAVVGLAVIGSLFAINREALWTAVRDDALWFVPMRARTPLLDHVPPQAQAVLWFRPDDSSHAFLESLGTLTGTMLLSNPPELLVAAATTVRDSGSGGSSEQLDGVALERGDSDIIPMLELVANGAPKPFRFDPVATTTTLDDGTRALVSSRWATALDTGHPRALLELVAHAPADAFVVAAATPVPPDLIDGMHGTFLGYARVHGSTFEAVAELDTDSDVGATALAVAAQTSFDHARKTAKPSDLACADASHATVTITHTGTHVHASVEIEVAAIAPLFACLDAKD